MRIVKPLLLAAGAVVLGVLVYRVGADPILQALTRLAWWQFALICVPYAIITVADTLGWRYAFAQDRAPFSRLYGARLAGEALNLVTALGSMGGEAVKAWLVRRDASYAESVPSVIIAKTTITIAQALFLLIGIALAAGLPAVDSQVLRGMLWLLGIEVLAVAGFLAAQVAGLLGRAGRLLRAAGVISDLSMAQALDAELRRYYREERGRLALSVVFHLLGWLLGAVEALAILWALGVDAGAVAATVIESLGSGVRFASFMVPASLGAFEGANAAAFAALGYGAGAGLAFSFVRRARQAVWIAIGLGVLVAMRARDRRDAGADPARPQA